MSKFVLVTLIETAELTEDARRTKILNTSFIKEVGIDSDYQTVITMGDGTKYIIDEEVMDFFDAVGATSIAAQ